MQQLLVSVDVFKDAPTSQIYQFVAKQQLNPFDHIYIFLFGFSFPHFVVT